MGITEKPFQGAPVTCLGEEHEEGLVGGWSLLRLGWIGHAYESCWGEGKFGSADKIIKKG